MTDVIHQRNMAMIGKVLCVEVEQGTKIFDANEKLLGIVSDRNPVFNGMTCYLSVNDYQAAKAALPAPPRKLPGLPGNHLN